MKKKGFTLIELLAVIIILAVIALIATPTILNVIEKARRNAFQQTAIGYYNAARYMYDEMYLDGKKEDINFTFEDGKQVSSNENYKLQVKGEVPKGGLVYLSKSGQILVSIHNNKYCANVSENGKVTLSENIEDCSTEITNIPEECFTIKRETLQDELEYLDGTEEWMTKEYNMLYYDYRNDGCPLNIDLVILPTEVNGEKVNGISYQSFTNYIFKKPSVKNVIIPEGIEVINDQAFFGVNIASVSLPKSLIYIGNAAFARGHLTNIVLPNNIKYVDGFDSNQLTDVNIPDSTEYLGGFSGNQLTNINIPKNVEILLDDAFSSNKLTSVEIPDSVKIISDFAFQGNQLSGVIIGRNVERIGFQAFGYNQLTSIEFPDSLVEIDINAFLQNQLVTVKLSKNLKNIGSSAFLYNQLMNIEIPDSVTNIGQNAFSDNQLTSVIIPNSVTTIGYGAFKNNQLASVIIPSSVTLIGTSAFNNNQLPEEQAIIYKRNSDGTEDKTTIVSYGGAKRDNIIIPSGVTTIENNAFSNNQLTSIVIPSTITSIASSAFSGNEFPNADAITIEGDSTRFDSTWTSIGFPAK